MPILSAFQSHAQCKTRFWFGVVKTEGENRLHSNLTDLKAVSNCFFILFPNRLSSLLNLVKKSLKSLYRMTYTTDVSNVQIYLEWNASECGNAMQRLSWQKHSICTWGKLLTQPSHLHALDLFGVCVCVLVCGKKRKKEEEKKEPQNKKENTWGKRFRGNRR